MPNVKSTSSSSYVESILQKPCQCFFLFLLTTCSHTGCEFFTYDSHTKSCELKSSGNNRRYADLPSAPHENRTTGWQLCTSRIGKQATKTDLVYCWMSNNKLYYFQTLTVAGLNGWMRTRLAPAQSLVVLGSIVLFGVQTTHRRIAMAHLALEWTLERMLAFSVLVPH